MADEKREPMLTRDQIVNRLHAIADELDVQQTNLRQKAAKLESSPELKRQAAELRERATILDRYVQETQRLIEDITIEKPPMQGVAPKGIEGGEAFGKF